MAKLFDMNNPIWKFMGKVADMFLLTLYWFLFSIPVVTIGASTTALYYTALKAEKDKEGYLFRTFKEAFKENFKQSTIIWLIMLAIGSFFGVDLYFYYNIDAPFAVVAFWGFVVLSVLYLFVLTMVFPLTSRLDAGVKKLFFMSFMVSIQNFSWTLFMLVATICILACSLFVLWPLMLISVGAIAWIHAKILVMVIFPRYNWNEED